MATMTTTMMGAFREAATVRCEMLACGVIVAELTSCRATCRSADVDAHPLRIDMRVGGCLSTAGSPCRIIALTFDWRGQLDVDDQVAAPDGRTQLYNVFRALIDSRIERSAWQLRVAPAEG